MMRTYPYLRCVVVFLWIAAFGRPLEAAVVCNAGYPGENTEQLLRRMPSVLASCPGASIVVLFAGMNDAVNDKRFLDPERTRANISAMLQELVKRHIDAVVVTLHTPDIQRLLQRHAPSDYGNVPPTQRIADTNQAIYAAARERGARVADFHEALESAGGATPVLSTDGVHFNRDGYRLLAKTVIAALPPGASRRKILCFGDSLTYGIGVREAAPSADDADTYPQQLRRLLDDPAVTGSRTHQ